MNKQKYMLELERHLKALPVDEMNDILADYREHFEIGLSNGKSEEAICSALGAPRTVAQECLINRLVNAAHVSTSTVSRVNFLGRILLLFFVLAPFTFLMLVGPILTIVILTFVGWVLPLAGGFAIITVMGFLLSKSLAVTLGTLSGLALFFMLLGSLGLAVLGVLLMVALSRALVKLLICFFRWNLNFIMSKPAANPAST